MSDMNFLERLLDGAAMEWKTLDEIANFANGKGHEKDITEDGEYVVVNSKFISTDGRVAKFSNIQICPLFKDDILLVMSDLPNGRALSRTFIVDADDRYTLNQRIGRITVKNQEKILPKFLHCFLNRTPQLLKYDNGVDQTNLRKDQILGVKIPIPSLEDQSEIVRILDTFTALTAELIAELSAELSDRQKQYNYYRDRLLTFEEGEVEWKTLGDLCVIGDGLHGTPKYDDSGEYYFINGNNLDNGRIVYNDKTKKVDELIFKKHGIVFTVESTVFMSINGTIGSVSFFNNEKIVLGKSVAFFNIKSSELYSRFLFYFLLTEYSKNYFEAQKTGSTIKNLGLKALRTFKIPIPPLAEQVRIASLLDKFDTLTTSISEGLPREIALRQQQYEYYRDLLLSFQKAED